MKRFFLHLMIPVLMISCTEKTDRQKTDSDKPDNNEGTVNTSDGTAVYPQSLYEA